MTITQESLMKFQSNLLSVNKLKREMTDKNSESESESEEQNDDGQDNFLKPTDSAFKKTKLVFTSITLEITNWRKEERANRRMHQLKIIS